MHSCIHSFIHSFFLSFIHFLHSSIHSFIHPVSATQNPKPNPHRFLSVPHKTPNQTQLPFGCHFIWHQHHTLNHYKCLPWTSKLKSWAWITYKCKWVGKNNSWLVLIAEALLVLVTWPWGAVRGIGVIIFLFFWEASPEHWLHPRAIERCHIKWQVSVPLLAPGSSGRHGTAQVAKMARDLYLNKSETWTFAMCWYMLWGCASP